jgi:hypothetical protein
VASHKVEIALFEALTMKDSKVPDLVEFLWATLRDTEGREGLKADDPAFIEFRRNVLRITADLEQARSQEDAAETKCA